MRATRRIACGTAAARTSCCFRVLCARCRLGTVVAERLPTHNLCVACPAHVPCFLALASAAAPRFCARPPAASPSWHRAPASARRTCKCALGCGGGRASDDVRRRCLRRRHALSWTGSVSRWRPIQSVLIHRSLALAVLALDGSTGCASRLWLQGRAGSRWRGLAVVPGRPLCAAGICCTQGCPG